MNFAAWKMPSGGVDFDGVVDGSRGEDLCVGLQIDGVARTAARSASGEIARVEAVLVDEGEVMVVRRERREDFAEGFGREVSGEELICDCRV